MDFTTMTCEYFPSKRRYPENIFLIRKLKKAQLLETRSASGTATGRIRIAVLRPLAVTSVLGSLSSPESIALAMTKKR